MARLILRPVSLMLALLTAAVLVLRVGYGIATAQPPRLDVFASCERSCWHGLELGTVEWRNVEQFFDQHSMAISVQEMNSGNAIHRNLYVHIPDYQTSIVYNAQNAAITSIAVDRPGCPAHIIMTYGIPKKIVTNTWVYWLLYPEQNIKMAIPTGLHDAVTPKEGYYISLVSDREFSELALLESVRWSVVQNRILSYPCA